VAWGLSCCAQSHLKCLALPCSCSEFSRSLHTGPIQTSAPCSIDKYGNSLGPPRLISVILAVRSDTCASSCHVHVDVAVAYPCNSNYDRTCNREKRNQILRCHRWSEPGCPTDFFRSRPFCKANHVIHNIASTLCLRRQIGPLRTGCSPDGRRVRSRDCRSPTTGPRYDVGANSR